jgi:hypothetical protein
VVPPVSSSGISSRVADCGEVADADRIDRIGRLERLRAATAALQAAESVRFAQSQAAAQMAAEVHPKAIGRGIADQIALACRLSPSAGSRRLGVARALWFDLPETYRRLAAGDLSEQVAESVVAETRHLDPQTRRQVDAQIVATGIAEMGPKAAVRCARKHAYEADPRGHVERGRNERRKPARRASAGP